MKSGIADKIYKDIKFNIIELKLQAGAPLIEEELALKYNVSRTPIRQALRQLEAENFVTIMPYRGCYVKMMSQKDIEEIYTIRALLEGYCVFAATQIISEENLRIIESDIKEGLRNVKRGLVKGFGAEGEKIHQIPIEICGNQRIKQILKNIDEQNRWLHNYAVSVPGRLLQSCQEHLAIYEAMNRRDAKEAEKLMKDHLMGTKKDIMKSFLNAI